MRLKIVFSIVTLVLVNAIAYGQTLPCGGTDPDATCPIDSGVILLVVASSILASYALLKRRVSPAR